MSDTTKELVKEIDTDNYILKLEDFRDPEWIKPFKFYTIQFKSVASAIKHLDRAGKSGEDIVKALINSVIAARMRTKAKFKLLTEGSPNLDEIQKRKTEGNYLLIDQKEAEEFSPGEREPDSDSGLHKQYRLNLKKAQEAKAAGDIETAKKFFATAKEYWDELQAKALKAFELE